MSTNICGLYLPDYRKNFLLRFIFVVTILYEEMPITSKHLTENKEVASVQLIDVEVSEEELQVELESENGK